MLLAPTELTEYRAVGLATATPTPFLRGLVALLACFLVALTVVLWPRLGEPGPVLPGFVVAHQTTVAICDLFTAVLLFSQFAQFRSISLLILSCGYLATSILVMVFMASFPGVFGAQGVVGGNTDTPTWLWICWHLFFPAAVLLYATVRRPIDTSPQRAALVAATLTGGAVAAAYLLSTHNDALPPLIAGREFTSFNLRLHYGLMALCVAALAALQFRRSHHPVITLFLRLAVLAFLLDVLVSGSSGQRYSVGWYLGRADSLMASVVLCVVFVVESALLLRYANRAAIQLAMFNASLNAAHASKSRFFAAASHDLRQPFQAIALFTSALESHLTEAKAKQIFAHLVAAERSASDLLDNLLEVTRLNTGTTVAVPCDFAIAEAVGRIVEECRPLAEEKGLSLRLRLAEMPVHTDRRMLERMLRNLLVNAVRYTRSGGILVACRRRADRLAVEVWDTGIGIPSDKLAMIWEEFYQVGCGADGEAKGLGLGLSIVQRIAQLLGCEVSVKSRLGRGTVFAIILPREACAEPPRRIVPLVGGATESPSG
jgi:signal transduction histidine kinase